MGISTLVYAADRVDIPELIAIRGQFKAKYGKKFIDNSLKNISGVLNERVVAKLSVNPPAAYLIHTYLESICERYEVDWRPTIKLTAQQMIEPMAAPNGYSVQAAQGTGLVGATTGVQQEEEIYLPPNLQQANNSTTTNSNSSDSRSPSSTIVAPVAVAVVEPHNCNYHNIKSDINDSDVYAEAEQILLEQRNHPSSMGNPHANGGERPTAPPAEEEEA